MERLTGLNGFVIKKGFDSLLYPESFEVRKSWPVSGYFDTKNSNLNLEYTDAVYSAKCGVRILHC